QRVRSPRRRRRQIAGQASGVTETHLRVTAMRASSTVQGRWTDSRLRLWKFPKSLADCDQQLRRVRYRDVVDLTMIDLGVAVCEMSRARGDHPVAGAQQVRNVNPLNGSVGKQQHRMMIDIREKIGEVLCEHLVQPVLSYDAPGTGDLGVKSDLQHDTLPQVRGSGGRIASTRSCLVRRDQISSAISSGLITGSLGSSARPPEVMARRPAERSMTAPIFTLPAYTPLGPTSAFSVKI